MWHYKCIRPILNDHKTWPQFLCPNCRAVADLEADVEDPDAFDDWEDEEAEGEVATDSHDVPMSDGVDPAAAAEQSVTEDNALTTMTSQRLSIGNEVDPPLESTEDSEDDPQPPSLSPDSVSSDPPLVPNSGTSLLIRRNANRVTPPRHQPLPPTTEESPAANANFTNYLRPITPTQPLMDLGDSSMRAPVPGEALTPNTSEMLNSDGPMTPTNNAGPFVFDGSAGRAAGRRVATTLSEGSDGAQPNAW